jgi:diguanylate cyclase (GGDEF)-like protein
VLEQVLVHEVVVALDGESALEIVNEENIDLILLDIMMPGMDGYEVCAKLKENNKTKYIPVIFITASTSEESIEKAYDTGGIDYVTKPFKPKELLARVNRELKMQQLIKDLKASREELKALAITDPLTKLYNRRYFSEISKDIFDLMKRGGKGLSVIMADIDRFKSINDNHGHQIGDNVIATAAEIIQKLKRTSDVACRYGGEEFVLLLPDTSAEGAGTIAEKIRAGIESFKMETVSGKILNFTVSLGVSEVDFNKENNIEEGVIFCKKCRYCNFRFRQRKGNNGTR